MDDGVTDGDLASRMAELYTEVVDGLAGIPVAGFTETPPDGADVSAATWRRWRSALQDPECRRLILALSEIDAALRAVDPDLDVDVTTADEPDRRRRPSPVTRISVLPDETRHVDATSGLPVRPIPSPAVGASQLRTQTGRRPGGIVAEKASRLQLLAGAVAFSALGLAATLLLMSDPLSPRVPDTGGTAMSSTVQMPYSPPFGSTAVPSSPTPRSGAPPASGSDATLLTALGRRDHTLVDLPGCLTANGASPSRVVGVTRIRGPDRPDAVVILLTTDRIGRFFALVVGPTCGRDDPALVERRTIGEQPP